MIGVDAPVLDVDPFALDVLADPLPADTAIREAAPVVFLPAHGLYATGRHALVSAAFRDAATFSSAAGTGLADIRRGEGWRPPSVLLDTDPPEHDAARRVMNRVLSPRALAELEERFAVVAADLVDEACEQGELDAAGIAERFPLTVLPDAVGMASEGRDHLLPYAALNFESMGPPGVLRDAAERGAAVGAGEWSTAREYVTWQMRREALSDDGIGAAIYAFADRGDVTEADAGLLVRSFLSAGIDTTVLALASVVHELARRPEVWALLRDDPSRVRAVFDEGMRLHTPSPVIGRTTTRPVELDGVTVPADARVLLCLGAANRDPRRFADPDAFDPFRTAGAVTFGAGVHNCVGQAIARLEAQALLGELARRVERIEPAGESVPRLSNWLRGFSSVPVRLVPSSKEAP
ncbi:cytochrome P450 [Actinomycetospora termitidis]|uniref:Cytochrome P450 n=1 Tax=Actinomycetospora termitidis TaxID=3053470 RepID=A0ABT7M932_9PSEU|nr:cytochrome P450 [Actinomycetospora sp. Odt1-22]MDL5157113.1 cytochrome P450 [Actinomycetospora sp. Odt1-22]